MNIDSSLPDNSGGDSNGVKNEKRLNVNGKKNH